MENTEVKCVFAQETEDQNVYLCEVTNEPCDFKYPNSELCVEKSYEESFPKQEETEDFNDTMWGGNNMAGCACAKRTDQYHGWECEVTGGACAFYIPNSKSCAEMFGEGPDAYSEEQIAPTVEGEDVDEEKEI